MRWGLFGLALGWFARGWWERTRAASDTKEGDELAPGYVVDELISDVPPAAAFARGPVDFAEDEPADPGLDPDSNAT